MLQFENLIESSVMDSLIFFYFAKECSLSQSTELYMAGFTSFLLIICVCGRAGARR